MPGNGRLNFKKASSPTRYGAWISQNKRDNSWFQVDFGRFVKVRIISTQGREDAQRWVKKYRVTYSYDGTFFRDYKEDGYVKVIFTFKIQHIFVVKGGSLLDLSLE